MTAAAAAAAAAGGTAAPGGTEAAETAETGAAATQQTQTQQRTITEDSNKRYESVQDAHENTDVSQEEGECVVDQVKQVHVQQQHSIVQVSWNKTYHWQAHVKQVVQLKEGELPGDGTTGTTQPQWSPLLLLGHLLVPGHRHYHRPAVRLPSLPDTGLVMYWDGSGSKSVTLV